MEILVCFRVVPDASMASEENWLSGQGVCLGGYLRRVLDTYDECALETALRLRDSLAESETDVSLSAVTIETLDKDAKIYEQLFALGFESVTRIDCGCDLSFSPIEKARVLSEFVNNRTPTDLILAGMRGGLGGSGLLPSALAEYLDLPHFPAACSVQMLTTGELELQSASGSYISSGKLPLPLVVSMGNAPGSLMRIPTIKQKLSVRGKCATELKISAAEQPRSMHMTRPQRSRQCAFIEGGAEQLSSEILNLLKGEHY